MKTPFFFLLVALVAIQGTARAEVPLLSPDELHSESSDIVVGDVRAVYTAIERSKNWEDKYSVAEISVTSAEKGDAIKSGNVIYAHFWNKKWIGKGNSEPHSRGHDGVSKGDVVRAHLVRKDRTYHVLLPNGFDSLKTKESKQTSAQSSDLKPSNDDALASVQGKWIQTVEADRGKFTITKEHKGLKTILTVTDSDDQVVEEKSSEFRLETNGRVRVFTFFNNVFTAGPNKGRMRDGSTSYIYRVTGDTFVEVRGMLVDDDTRPAVFTWERVRE